MCAGESINPGNHWDMSTEMVLVVVQHSFYHSVWIRKEMNSIVHIIVYK